jgi:hypothetical protein
MVAQNPIVVYMISTSTPPYTMTLNPIVQREVDRLLHDCVLSDLYKEYVWKGDSWQNGFVDLFRLEQLISTAARNYSLGKTHLLEVAEWGRHPNPKKIACHEPIKITLYVNNFPAEWLEREPENAVWILEGQTHGFGPTYCSKLLHFAVPQVFGAIDSRLVRTFGLGDPDAQRCPLLNLKVSRSGKRWAISSSQSGWPGEYGTWTAIINYIAKTLNNNGNECPHPEIYYKSQIRENGVWLPADVETALFSYATQIIEGQ